MFFAPKGNGIYWDPQAGRWLVRGGDGVNGYDTTNPIRHDDGLFSGRSLSLAVAGAVGNYLGGRVGSAIVVAADDTLLRLSEGSTAVNALEGGATTGLVELATGIAIQSVGGILARTPLGRAVVNWVENLLPNCFVAGTLVAMADGSFEKIEDVREGDLVLSRNPETGVTEAKAVLARSVKIAPQVLTLTLADPATRLTQTITCTPGHPFYVQGRGFVLAGSLGIGTSIVTRAGPCLSVAAITFEPKSTGGVLVYNFTVDGDHTYFVGTVDGGAWVHNASLRWYGSTELSRRAIQFRFENNAFDGRNVSVFKLTDGSLKPYFSDPITGVHAERIGARNHTAAEVKAIYSELEPCGSSGSREGCSDFLSREFPNARVEYSFPLRFNQARVGVVKNGLRRVRRYFSKP